MGRVIFQCAMGPVSCFTSKTEHGILRMISPALWPKKKMIKTPLLMSEHDQKSELLSSG